MSTDVSKIDASWSKIIGKAILLSSMQFAIGSVEMSSKFSVMNFSKDQETLQRASDALAGYLLVGVLWTIGTTLILYSNYKWRGALASIICNILIIAWVWVGYEGAFAYAASQNPTKMHMPTMRFPTFGAGVID